MLRKLLSSFQAAEVEGVGFSWRPLGWPRLQRCVLFVCDSLAQECHSTWHSIAVKQPGEAPGSVCAQQPQFGISAVFITAEQVPHCTVQEPPLSPGLQAVSVCGSEAPREPHPHASRLMGPRFISVFQRHGKSCLLLLSTIPSHSFCLPFLQRNIFKKKVS